MTPERMQEIAERTSSEWALTLYNLYGMNRADAIYVAEALRFAMCNAEFMQRIGTFGTEHLYNLLDEEN